MGENLKDEKQAKQSRAAGVSESSDSHKGSFLTPPALSFGVTQMKDDKGESQKARETFPYNGEVTGTTDPSVYVGPAIESGEKQKLKPGTKVIVTNRLYDYVGLKLSKEGGKIGYIEEKNVALSHEVSNSVSETISDAPAAYDAWNGTYGWDSKYQLLFSHDKKKMTVKLKLFSSASDTVKQKWATAVESKWGGVSKLEVIEDPAKASEKDTYDIDMDVVWTKTAADAHYTIDENAPAATEGGRAGLGGTTSMTGWGRDDTVDITHEVGHMLGSVEDYFTTDGTDHTHGGTKKGFRDTGGGIMNNPSENPFKRHYEPIRKEAVKALKVRNEDAKIK